MKIAACFSGHPRCVALNFLRVKYYLLSQYPDIDIFIHTWFSADDVGKRYMQAGQTHPASEVIAPNLPDIIKELYNPVRIIVEPNHNFLVKPEYNDRKFMFDNPFYVLSGTYSIWAANELKNLHEKENNFKYDAVVRVRFDWSMDIPLDISKYDLSIIHTEWGCPHRNSAGDQFALSNSDNMNVYSNLHFEIDSHWREGNLMFDPGPLLYYHLTKHKIPFKAEPAWIGRIERSVYKVKDGVYIP